MNGFTLLLLATAAVYVSLRAWLAGRQIVSLKAHRDRGAADPGQGLSGAALARVTDYALARTRLEIAAACLEAVFLLAWTIGGGLDLVDAHWRALDLPGIATGAAVIASSLLFMEGFRLPVTLYRLFVVDQRFGLNRMTASLFLADLARKAGLLLAVSFSLGALALWLMGGHEFGRWILLWGLWTACQLAWLWLYPALLAPLLNSVAPLAQGDLRDRLTGLIARSGFALGALDVMDGSRRSGHANAHVEGLGRTKHVVLLDTLIEALDPPQVEAVTAHELGHIALRHIQKFHVLRAVLALVWLSIFAWLADQAGFLPGLGVNHPSPEAALVVLLAASPLVAWLARPALFYLRRHFEMQADAYAARHSDPGDLSQALLRLSHHNLSPPFADPLYAAFNHAHPSLTRRIAKLNAGGAELASC